MRCWSWLIATSWLQLGGMKALRHWTAESPLLDPLAKNGGGLQSSVSLLSAGQVPLTQVHLGGFSVKW